MQKVISFCVVSSNSTICTSLALAWLSSDLHVCTAMGAPVGTFALRCHALSSKRTKNYQSPYQRDANICPKSLILRQLSVSPEILISMSGRLESEP